MTRMLKIGTLGILIALMSYHTGYCVPAITSVQEMQQPDGTTFQAKIWGDEGRHGWETADGYTIVQDPTTRVWRYATEGGNGRGAAVGAVVGRANATPGSAKHIRPARGSAPRKFRNGAANVQLPTANRQPVTGTRPVPVLMVNFSDTTPTYNAADFDHLLFGTGNKSMKEYYEEVSHGAFSVSAGTAGVTGWYTASHTHDFYGTNDANGYDRYPATLVREAVVAADASIDFSQYDSDGDCRVDSVVIVHQGSGEEAGGPDSDIWSHSWSLNSASYFGDGAGQYLTNDVAPCGQIIINNYVIQPEKLWGQLQTIGVFAHEYGHALGLPDLYDVDYSSSGIGDWGLMSGGSWNYVSWPGDSPAHLCAWSKYFLGWVNPVQVSGSLVDQAIAPAAEADDVYLFYSAHPANPNEYFLVENRQKVGFDKGLPGSGLAIWHIDEAKASYANEDNSQECAPPMDCATTHYRVALVQADGDWDLELGFNQGDRGDLFPGTSHNTAFTFGADPDSVYYDGTPSHLSITGIVESGTTIRATLTQAYAIAPTVSGNGSIWPATPAAVEFGGSVTFTITPDAGAQISDVLVDGQSVGAVGQYTFSNTQLDHEIRAVFNGGADSSLTSGQGDSGGGGGGGCFISSSLF
ncbi:MAG: M6 family metalloprotease domain-containing protein [Desulfobacteraceae bacterium]|nr:M6 family metalloprotease domain-containing protein [Desulfobacteraceae bacterium]